MTAVVLYVCEGDEQSEFELTVTEYEPAPLAVPHVNVGVWIVDTAVPELTEVTLKLPGARLTVNAKGLFAAVSVVEPDVAVTQE